MENLRTFVGTISDIESLNPSIDGNPAYRALVTAENGETLWGRTARNATDAWGLHYLENRTVTVEYHFTRTGNIIYDHVKEKKEEN